MINNEYVLLLLDTMDLKRPVLFYTIITCISEGYFFISLELAQINSGLNQHTKISIVTIKTYVDHFICEHI